MLKYDGSGVSWLDDGRRLVDWQMPSQDGGGASSAGDVANSTAQSTTNDDRPVAAAAAAAVAGDVDMETSMTTTADVQVHQPKQQHDSAGPQARHVRSRFTTYCNSHALSLCLCHVMTQITPAVFMFFHAPLRCVAMRRRAAMQHNASSVWVWVTELVIRLSHSNAEAVAQSTVHYVNIEQVFLYDLSQCMSTL